MSNDIRTHPVFAAFSPEAREGIARRAEEADVLAERVKAQAARAALRARNAQRVALGLAPEGMPVHGPEDDGDQ